MANDPNICEVHSFSTSPNLSELVLEVCPTCTDTSAQTAAPLADRSVNDRLVELRPPVDEMRFEFIDVHLTILNIGVIGTYNFAK